MPRSFSPAFFILFFSSPKTAKQGPSVCSVRQRGHCVMRSLGHDAHPTLNTFIYDVQMATDLRLLSLLSLFIQLTVSDCPFPFIICDHKIHVRRLAYGLALLALGHRFQKCVQVRHAPYESQESPGYHPDEAGLEKSVDGRSGDLCCSCLRFLPTFSPPHFSITSGPAHVSPCTPECPHRRAWPRGAGRQAGE
jgi:hypothetical protein